MSKDILYRKDVRARLLAGVTKLSNTVSVTMGPKGRFVILGKVMGAPTVTKDGVSVAREIVLDDQFEELGCQLVKEVAGRTADVAGDGTTTATVLAHEILSRGIEHMDADKSALDFKRGIEFALSELTKELNSVAKPIETYEDLKHIATVSVNSDIELGEVIAGAYHSVGTNGFVSAVAMPNVKTHYKLIDGVELNTGFSSTGFLDEGVTTWSAEHANILIFEKDISALTQEEAAVLTKVIELRKPLVIMSKSLTKNALEQLTNATKNGLLKFCHVNLPTLAHGSNYKMWLQDIAMKLGTVVISDDFGVPLSQFSLSKMGYAEEVHIDIGTTKFVGPKENPAIEGRIKMYEDNLQKLIGDMERNDILKRMSFLSGKAASIIVGYSTESELREVGDRIDDAIAAIKSAREEGYVPGGGTTLLKLARIVEPRIESLPEKQRFGAKALIDACKRPFVQILENAYVDFKDIEPVVLSDDKPFDFGYNVDTEQFGSLIEMGIIDPKKVTRTALENATKVAMLLIMTDAAVVENKEAPSGWQPPAGYRLPDNIKLNHKW